MISVQETDTLIPCEWRARAARNRMAMMDAVDDYNQTHRTGFQQPGRPQFLFAHKQNKYSLALGGFIALRTKLRLRRNAVGHRLHPFVDSGSGRLRFAAAAVDGCLYLAHLS